MPDRWIVTPRFFEEPEPALVAACPVGTALNEVAIADREPASLAALHKPIADFTAAAARAGDRAISVAGDCCAAVPVAAGLSRAGVAATLVWLDAHGDFNTPETSPSGFLGGMPLAMMAGRGPQWMCEAVGLAPIPEERIVLVDARDLDPEEAEAVRGSKLIHIGLDALPALPIEGPVHLHIDLDIVDAAECPGFRYPVAGGPSVDAVAAAVVALDARTRIAAVSVSGWTEALDPDGHTGAAAKRILGALS